MPTRLIDQSGAVVFTGEQRIGGTPGQVATVQANGTIGPAAASGGVVNVATKNLSAVDLLALTTVSIPTLPALTGRNYYVVHAAVLHYRAGLTPYTGEVNLTFGYGATVADVIGAGSWAADGSSNFNDFLQSATDRYIFLAGPGVQAWAYSFAYWAPATIEAQPFSLASNSGNVVVPLAAGDGTVTVRTFYSVIDGAP